MSGNAIKDVARDFWYRSPGKDTRRARRINAELYRFQKIEEAAQALADYKGDDLGKMGELKKNLSRALKLSEEPAE